MMAAMSHDTLATSGGLPVRYPAPLRAGSRIAVTAPSSGVQPQHHARLDLALAHLRAQGFVVEEGTCLRHEVHSASASAVARAAELMQLLLRDDVDAVLPPWGGELAIELLDLLDWAALAHARPKWLIGYSDTSTLLLALTLRLGWASAHGPCLMDLVPGQSDALTARALAQLATLPGHAFEQQQSGHWQSQWTDFATAPGCTYQLDQPTRWWCLNRSGAVQMSGRLIGGCVDTLMHLAGSPHGDVPGFMARHGATLLYLENAELSPTAWVRALHHLRWAGWLDAERGIRGVLIGRSAAPDTSGAHELRYAQALESTLAALPCPVLVDVDIGHMPPQMLLITGARAVVHFSPAEGARVVQHLD